jgi:hypothetical protein
MAGRPTSLTPAVLKSAEESLKECPILSVLAGRLGVTDRTIRRWHVWGRVEAERREAGHAPDPKKDMYVLFCQTIKATHAGHKCGLWKKSAAGESGWQAAMTCLERYWPEEFSSYSLELKLLRKELADLRKAIQPS